MCILVWSEAFLELFWSESVSSEHSFRTLLIWISGIWSFFRTLLIWESFVWSFFTTLVIWESVIWTLFQNTINLNQCDLNILSLICIRVVWNLLRTLLIWVMGYSLPQIIINLSRMNHCRIQNLSSTRSTWRWMNYCSDPSSSPKYHIP